MSDEPEGFGDLDGEPIKLATFTLSGAAHADRRYAEGERVVLIVEATVSDQVTVKRQAGVLVRVHKLKIDAAAPPTDTLAAEAEAFLQAVTDEREGKAPLPFPDQDAGDADPGYVSDSRPDGEMPDPFNESEPDAEGEDE
jgi:hypothetical protein